MVKSSFMILGSPNEIMKESRKNYRKKKDVMLRDMTEIIVTFSRVYISDY